MTADPIQLPETAGVEPVRKRGCLMPILVLLILFLIMFVK